MIYASSVYCVAEAAKWEAVLARFNHDIYFSPDYHAIYERNGDGRAYAFVFETASHSLIYPFLLRRIEQVAGQAITEELYDIETVYGYSGPLADAEDPRFWELAWSSFAAWCRRRNVVAEFIRFHPLLNNSRLAARMCKVACLRHTVVLDLPDSAEALWIGYPKVQRNMVRKAQAQGLTCQEVPAHERLGDFLRLYLESMSRNRAASYYFFSEQYFEDLVALGERVRLFVVVQCGEVVAASLVLCHADLLHYHLSGGRPDALGANNLLLHTVALWGIERGFRRFHLGGGRTTSPSDALLNFKMSISRTLVPFCTGSRVHDRKVYNALCQSWTAVRGEAPYDSSYFLLYRL